LKTFKSSDYKTFEQIASLSQKSIKRVMSNFLKKHYKKIIETDKYIIAEGDIPVALVAHLDTVFKDPPEEIFFDQTKNVIWSPDGLGADDRAGVFGIVQIIRSGLRPHIIFTTDEEVGGIGATAVSILDCPFKDLKYIIELDRRGSNDCVFYNCDNQEFVNYVESFGFEWNFGSYSDICEICPSWEVAGVNLSIGYRDEHSIAEVLFVGKMLSTIEKVKKMLADAKKLKTPFKYIPAYKYSYGYGLDWYNSPSEVVKCNYCHTYHLADEMIPIVKHDKSTAYCCGDCEPNLAWCIECGNAFEKYSPEAPEIGTCPFCLEKKENK